MLEKVQLKKTWDLVFEVIIFTFVDKFWVQVKNDSKLHPFADFFPAFCIFS